jgi:hypothetical protein
MNVGRIQLSDTKSLKKIAVIKKFDLFQTEFRYKV